jgi:hypothetical protein
MRHSRLPSLSRAGGSEPSRFYPVPAKLIGNGTHNVSPRQNGEFEDAEKSLNSICSEFRALVERSIENDLLCGVVQRCQRPVHTQKVRELVKLKSEDCDLLDSLMAKHSAFEHSQPAEAPVDLPELEELLTDMKSLKKWREGYAKRPASAVAG